LTFSSYILTVALCISAPAIAHRIVGELRMLGIEVAKSTVEQYRVPLRTPLSPTWKTFLNNHMQDLVSLDFFTVPTVTDKVLFVLLILTHKR
jgi:putative transposase